ncbi:MAG: M56 family metallopeptidase, partial [Acetatifactor sp.]|nr:M56 family metallopeptidase [Acetatifactor sp.]
MNTLFSEIISENLLETAFLRCVNLSISASWLILAVLLLRLALRKAPRWICCLLWMLVGLRLLCPFTLQSPLSLIPSTETIPENILQSPAPAISSGIPAVDAQLNPIISASFAPSPEASANPLQIITFIASCIWLIGIFVMLMYLAGSFICLRLKMSTATRLRDNIRQSEFAGSPFILGILRPQIYVHYDLNGDELAHVLAHEQAHIARRDHLLKPLGFLILSVYW